MNEKRNFDIENRSIDLAIRYPSMRTLVDHISDQMLQEMLDHDGLQFEQPLDFSNRNIRVLICRGFFLRMYTLQALECVALSSLENHKELLRE